ncbi:MAG: amidase, partial [Chloroflexi bacterium]|nr:amidase [Chloroflexota bacterium]
MMEGRPTELHRLSLAELAPLIERREVSPVEVTRALVNRVRRMDDRINSFITLTAEQALTQARQAEEEIAAGGYRGPLHGVPLALKDLFQTAGVRTTGGSKILTTWIPDEDADCVARLRAAGAVLLGKLNMHEFAYGVNNNNAHYGPTRNPWDRERIPGGSSGGSGAAVAAGLCFGSLGSDTGGSIRIPAALCGITGLKPTYGRVSRRGVLPLSWSLDHAGPMARTVEDCAILLGAIAGHDPGDPTSSRRAVPDYRAALTGDVRGLRLGVPRAFFFERLDDEVRAAVEAALALLAAEGAVLVDVDVPRLRQSPAMSGPILSAEAGAYHYDDIRSRPEDYGAEVRSRIEAAQFVLAGDYLRAQQARTLLKRDLAAALRGVDALVMPTLPITAPKIGQARVEIAGAEADALGSLTRFMSPFNLTGLPAASVPCGFSAAGLPIGLQIAGRPFDEATVLRV